MFLYRIAQSAKRAKDLSGMGAFQFGGRWNSQGTYMLYTSENSSLAYLESLVHFDPENIPPQLFIMRLELSCPEKLIYTLPLKSYPQNWMEVGCLDNQRLGNQWVKAQKQIALKVRSAVNPMEYNYLLNPLFPEFRDMLKIVGVKALAVDARFQ